MNEPYFLIQELRESTKKHTRKPSAEQRQPPALSVTPARFSWAGAGIKVNSYIKHGIFLALPQHRRTGGASRYPDPGQWSPTGLCTSRQTRLPRQIPGITQCPLSTHEGPRGGPEGRRAAPAGPPPGPARCSQTPAPPGPAAPGAAPRSPLEEQPHGEDAERQREGGEDVSGPRVLQPAARRARLSGQVRPRHVVREPEALVPEPGPQRRRRGRRHLPPAAAALGRPPQARGRGRAPAPPRPSRRQPIGHQPRPRGGGARRDRAPHRLTAPARPRPPAAATRAGGAGGGRASHRTAPGRGLGETAPLFCVPAPLAASPAAAHGRC